MGLLVGVVGGAGSLLLTLAAALLFEELTLGALVRLIVAPKARDASENKQRDKNIPPPG